MNCGGGACAAVLAAWCCIEVSVVVLGLQTGAAKLLSLCRKSTIFAFH